MLISSLRYPGGKSKAALDIAKLIPSDVKNVGSPFFGGGSVELALISRGVKVNGYDIDNNLIAFWHELLTKPEELMKAVAVYHPLNKKWFNQIKKSIQTNPVKRGGDKAAQFYVLNRASFGGAGIYGGYSEGHARFTGAGIQALGDFKAEGLFVFYGDFKDTIKAFGQNRFMYCDPPYAVKSNLYKGHADFDHEGLAKLLTAGGPWILSYNDCPMIRDLYAGHFMIVPEYNYGMNTSKESNELLIFSKERKAI